jgi:hypothetical protein
VYLILFSLNIFLQINVDDLGSVFVELYTSLYIAFDDVLSEEIYQIYLFKPCMSQLFLQVLTLI